MGLLVEGQGLSVAHGDVTIVQKPITVEIPGFDRDELERTTQGNTAVHTKDVAKLANYESFTHNFPYDPVDVATWFTNRNTAKLHVITLPDSLGTFSVWAKVKTVSTVTNEGPGGRPVYDVTFTPVNLNGSGTETAPAFAAGS